MAHPTYDLDDDDGEERRVRIGSVRFKEFDCLACDANNPMDDGFGNNDEIFCQFCGATYQVKVTEDGTMKLREM